MKQIKIALLALLIFVGYNKMNAQNKNHPWSINFGVNSVDIKTPVDDTTTFFKDWGGADDLNILPTISRIAVGRYLDAGFSLELAASVNKIEKGYGWGENDALINDAYLGVDGSLLYSLNNLVKREDGWFNPYLMIGGGYSWFDWEGAGNLNGGLGINFWFSENIGLNIQTQYKHVFDDVDLHPYFQHSAGIKVQFGGTDTDGDGIYDDDDACPDVFGLEALQGCPDADGDGIADKDDQCPDLAGVAEYNGCPADKDGDGVYDKDDECPSKKGPAANKGCPWPDTDGDGVLDKDDKCPAKKGPAANKGCPWPDTDGDGILDKDDKCPKVKGVKEEQGCPKKVITQEAQEQLNQYAKTIYFNTAKSTFKPGVKEKLDMIAEIMIKYPKANFSIDGYTDSQGNDKYNQGLSERRAQAVMKYLVQKGVASSRLRAVGYGESNPIADNKTKDGRALNRRVEITLRK
ncbi:MAG: cell envelope biogenesis protein OmpA [Flavobacteriia bacterium]|nr:MAG: cell envelope biogenesis protein OmpA [Flavobacteriia bacterium]